MGYSCLARWTNSSTTGLDFVKQNIIRNLAGNEVGPWSLSLRSYRFTSKQTPIIQHMERSMYTLTTGDKTYVSLEDPLASMHADVVTQADSESTNPPQTPIAASTGRKVTVKPQHCRSTLVTVSTPAAFEQLMAQLNLPWVPTRQSLSTASGTAGSQRTVTVEGTVFKIGLDFLVRVGNVRLASGEVKGMFLEAEYLPLPVIQTQELITAMILSILPPIESANKIELVNVDDFQWSEVLWREEDNEVAKGTADNDDDIFTYEDEPDSRDLQKGDWMGPDRDLRSAFLIIGSLKMEGII